MAQWESPQPSRLLQPSFLYYACNAVYCLPIHMPCVALSNTCCFKPILIRCLCAGGWCCAQTIAAAWQSLVLDMVEYKATYKLRSTEDVFAALEENTVTLSTIKVG